MLKLPENTKKKKLKELTDSEKQDIFVDAISVIGVFKGLNQTAEELKTIYNSMKYFIDTKFSYLHVYEVLIIFEKGMTGEYGTTKVLSGETFVSWMKTYQTQNIYERDRKTVKENNEFVLKPKNIDADTKWIALAVLVRTQCDCGGIICDQNNISIPDIAEGLKQGKNIITGNKYTAAECEKIARESKSLLFAPSKRYL